MTDRFTLELLYPTGYTEWIAEDYLIMTDVTGTSLESTVQWDTDYLLAIF